MPAFPFSKKGGGQYYSFAPKILVGYLSHLKSLFSESPPPPPARGSTPLPPLVPRLTNQGQTPEQGAGLSMCFLENMTKRYGESVYDDPKSREVMWT